MLLFTWEIIWWDFFCMIYLGPTNLWQMEMQQWFDEIMWPEEEEEEEEERATAELKKKKTVDFGKGPQRKLSECWMLLQWGAISATTMVFLLSIICLHYQSSDSSLWLSMFSRPD